VVFRSGDASNPWRIGPDGKEARVESGNLRGHASAFGPDGRQYSSAHEQKEIVRFDAAGKETVVARDIQATNLIVLPNGAMYATRSGGGGYAQSTVWYVSPQGEKRAVDDGIKERFKVEKPFSTNLVGGEEIRELVSPQPGLHSAWGLALSPDHSLLYVSDSIGQFVYSYQIQPDGSLKNRQPYYHLHLPDDEYGSQARGMCVDTAGRLYVATALGVQVCDQAGRVNCILPTPSGTAFEVTFGGPDFDTLYVASGDKVFRRKVKVKGAPAFAAPAKPLPPRL
jgi:sugar lactone lactonase YvrE